MKRYRLPAWLEFFVLLTEQISKRLHRDQVTVYAAQCSFFVLISSIPFVMLLLTLVRFVVPVDPAELLRAMSDFLPSAVMSFASDLIEELFGEAGFPVISATAVMLLWSASRGMRGIADGIRKVYGIDHQRSYLVGAIASLFYTLVLVLLLLGSLVVLVFGRTIQLLLSRWIPPLARLLEWVLSRRNIIFFLILAVIFWIGYKGLTGRAFSWRAQLPGALFASGGWLIFSFGYAFYIDHFSHYSVIYGSLTAVVLLMLWLYICMVILLLGAEFNLWLMEFQQK